MIFESSDPSFQAIGITPNNTLYGLNLDDWLMIPLVPNQSQNISIIVTTNSTFDMIYFPSVSFYPSNFGQFIDIPDIEQDSLYVFPVWWNTGIGYWDGIIIEAISFSGNPQFYILFENSSDLAEDSGLEETVIYFQEDLAATGNSESLWVLLYANTELLDTTFYASKITSKLGSSGSQFF